MHRDSSRFVRHDATPREQVLDAARSWATKLRRDHPEIVRIGYFGSYARGDYVPGSDLDVLIEVSSTSATRRADRADPYRAEKLPVGVDLFVYTTHELESARMRPSGFVTTIDREVCWLT